MNKSHIDKAFYMALLIFKIIAARRYRNYSLFTIHYSLFLEENYEH